MCYDIILSAFKFNASMFTNVNENSINFNIPSSALCIIIYLPIISISKKLSIQACKN